MNKFKREIKLNFKSIHIVNSCIFTSLSKISSHCGFQWFEIQNGHFRHIRNYFTCSSLVEQCPLRTCTSCITANFFHIHHITIQYGNTFSHLFTLSTFTLSYDTMSYETTFDTTLYQYDIHIIVSRKNVSYDSHLHFVQSWGWICAVSVKTGKMTLIHNDASTIVSLYNVFVHVRYSQKETPVLFSWEFSCNQLAHRESIACNWL